MVTIYALIDPETLEEKYIGRTSRPLIKRLAQHIHAKELSNGMKAHWISQLKKKGDIPLFKELEIVSREDAMTAETKWIKHFEEKGNYLFNIVQLSDSINNYNKRKEVKQITIENTRVKKDKNICTQIPAKRLIKRISIRQQEPNRTQRRNIIYYDYFMKHEPKKIVKWLERGNFPEWFKKTEKALNTKTPLTSIKWMCNDCTQQPAQH